MTFKDRLHQLLRGAGKTVNQVQQNVAPAAQAFGSNLMKQVAQAPVPFTNRTLTFGDLHPANEQTPILGGYRRFVREGLEQDIERQTGNPFESKYAPGSFMRYADLGEQYRRTPEGMINMIASVGGGRNNLKQGVNILQKDAHQQVLRNKDQFLNVLKRFDTQLGDMAPAQGVDRMDVNLGDDVTRAYQQLFGANRRAPLDLGEMVQDIRTVFREANTMERLRQGVDINEGGIGLGIGTIKPNRVKQTFKTDKFPLNKTEVERLKGIQRDLGLDLRSVRSMDDVAAMAEELGTDPQKLLKEIVNGRVTDKEVVALGNVITTSSKRISDLTARLRKDPANETLRQQLITEENLLDQAIRKRIKGGTEAGRAVNAFRAIANKTMDPAYWLDKAKRQLGDKPLTGEVSTAIEDLIAKNDRLGLATFVAKLGESTGMEKAIGLWKAGLLTGLRTSEANVISNTIHAGLETLKDIPAAGFDIARSTVTGGPRAKSFALKEVTSQPRAALRGVKKGIDILRTGVDIDDVSKSEVYRPLRFGDSRGGRIAQKYTDFVFGNLNAQDQVFKEAAFARSLQEQAKTIGINQKLSGKQIADLVANPTEEMLEQATKDARITTFTNDNALADAVRGFKRAGGDGVSTATDFIAPFTRTPTNVAAQFYNYTPAGFVTKVAKKLVSKNSVTDRELSEAFGRSATGAGIMWLGAKLGEAGLITGPSPSSEAERAQWELEGKTPNSVFVNGKWRSVQRISPMGNLLILGAQAKENGADVATTAMEGVKSLTEQNFLKGLSSGLKAITEPDRFGASLLENTVSGYVPSILSDVARGMDDVRRKPEGMVERITARLPGLRETVPSRLNSLGEPIEEQGGFAGAMLDPFNSRTPTDDPLIKEFSRVGYNLNHVGETIGGKELTRDEQRAYQRLAGEKIRQILPEVIASEGYSDLSTDQQRDLIENAVNAAKRAAREEITPKLGSISESGLAAEAAEEGEILDEGGSGIEISAGGKGKSYTVVQDGKVKTINLNLELKEPKWTGVKEVDKRLRSSYQSKITNEQNDVIDLMEAGKISEEEGIKLIAKLEELRSTSEGGSGSGGKKGKSGKQGMTELMAALKKLRSAGETKSIRLSSLKASGTGGQGVTRSVSLPELRADLGEFRVS